MNTDTKITSAIMEENFNDVNLENITRIEYHGQLVLTTEQLADFYGCPTVNLKNNFKNNFDRFIYGKHYFKVEGEELQTVLKLLQVKNFYSQNSSKIRSLYLWTKKGAARHCKSIGTNRAWDVFEVLEDNYFTSNKKIKNLSDFQKGTALAKLAQSAQDPQTKKRIVAMSANLILGENFLTVPPETSSPSMSISLF